MNSQDVAHVPAPDPAKLWDFRPGDNFLVLLGSVKVSLMLQELGQRRAKFMMTVERREGTKELRDWLNLNAPCVALKLPTGEPVVTLTLRAISNGTAFVQVTAHPSFEQRPRPGVDADMRRRATSDGTAREKQLVRELAGIECAGCGNPKEPGKTYCRKCYYRLPPRLRSALYKRIGAGYLEVCDEAAAFLKARAAKDGKL